MRKHLTVILAIFIVFMFIVPTAWSAGEKVTGTISSMVVARDVNGNEYIRFIVPMDMKLSGVEYVLPPVLSNRDC